MAKRRLSWDEREAKLAWARRNPEKVREANRRWREANRAKVRRQTAARTRAWRERERAEVERRAKQCEVLDCILPAQWTWDLGGHRRWLAYLCDRCKKRLLGGALLEFRWGRVGTKTGTKLGRIAGHKGAVLQTI